MSTSKKADDWVSMEILDDSSASETEVPPPVQNSEDSDEEVFEMEVVVKKKFKKVRGKLVEVVDKPPPPMKRQRQPKTSLKISYLADDCNLGLEIGVDEAGRGPMFGRVYSGAVVLPKDPSLFNHSLMKDSKKFTSKKKIDQVADYIKEHAIAWAVAFEDEQTIDRINILQATQQAMHKAIASVRKQLKAKGYDHNKVFLLIDGNYFKPVINETDGNKLPFDTIEGGDNAYCSIAGASILAKVERDKYIEELCALHPDLVTKYGIDTNKGYGSKKHMDGIKEHGITIWHRRTFGICKEY